MISCMNKYKIFTIIFTICICTVIIFPYSVKGCKDIVVVDDATEGDYNLLLKVRDPSRLGLQVLCIVPEEYKYTYHYPWTGKQMSLQTKHKYIGVATLGDTIPNIVKPGMALSDVGLAFGDADTRSNWKNPTKNAWDDFDWIRYACENANNEDEAVMLMTKDIVDDLHATGVSENLFIVGPKKAYVIEADAYRYNVKEINDILVMSNYPKELWRTQVHRCLPIASSFDITKEQYVRKGRTLRLNSLFGVKIVDINKDYVVAQQVPFLKFDRTLRLMGNKVKIELGERETVGDYSVELLDIEGNKAKIKLCYKFKAWEDKMMEIIQEKYGYITVKDMINWSRLDSDDLDGLRPMCEDIFEYEAVAIYKIPHENYETLSGGWFAANHACSSIYVPFHIIDNNIYDPYVSGEAADLSLDLLNQYGHNNLITMINNIEDVFIYEVKRIEQITQELIQHSDVEVSSFLTVSDKGMQQQAYETGQIWKKLSDEKHNQKLINIIEDIWEYNYSCSLENMKNAIIDLKKMSETKDSMEHILDLSLGICKMRIDMINSIGKNISIPEEEYRLGKKLLKQDMYELGFKKLKNCYRHCDMYLRGNSITSRGENYKNSNNISILSMFDYFFIGFFILIAFLIIIKKKQDQLY